MNLQEKNLDLEDLLQCLCAKENGCGYLITNDKKFCDCGVKVMSSVEFLNVVSLTEARNNLKAVFDSVYRDHEEVIIHRKGRENIKREPFEGIGKPEPLKHELSGFWSRRITDEHYSKYTVYLGKLLSIV